MLFVDHIVTSTARAVSSFQMLIACCSLSNNIDLRLVLHCCDLLPEFRAKEAKIGLLTDQQNN